MAGAVEPNAGEPKIAAVQSLNESLGKDLSVVVYAVIEATRDYDKEKQGGGGENPEAVYLMALRSQSDDTNPGHYGFPGGSVKEKEIPKEETQIPTILDILDAAVAREVKEEAGLEVELQVEGHVTVLWGPSNRSLEGKCVPLSIRPWKTSSVRAPFVGGTWNPGAREAGYLGPYGHHYWRGKVQGRGDIQPLIKDGEKCYVFVPCKVKNVSGCTYPNGDAREVFGLHWATVSEWRWMNCCHVRLQPVVALFAYAFDDWSKVQPPVAPTK